MKRLCKCYVGRCTPGLGITSENYKTTKFKTKTNQRWAYPAQPLCPLHRPIHFPFHFLLLSMAIIAITEVGNEKYVYVNKRSNVATMLRQCEKPP